MNETKIVVPVGQTVADAFPEVHPGVTPFGTRLLVQIRCAKSTLNSGIIIPSESRDTEKWNTQVAKVIAIGPVAFKNRDTLKKWPEGDWCVEGSYVRVPKYGGDRWELPLDSTQPKGEKCMFALFNDLDILGGIEEDDVLTMVAFL